MSVVYMAAVFHTAVYLTEVFGAAVHFTAVYIAAVHLTIVYYKLGLSWAKLSQSWGLKLGFVF